MDPEYKEITEKNQADREVYAERAETKAPEHSSEELKALALAYARYLAEKNMAPGDATFVDPEELLADNESSTAEESEEPSEVTEEPAETAASEDEAGIINEAPETETAESVESVEAETEEAAEVTEEKDAGAVQKKSPDSKKQKQSGLYRRTVPTEKEIARVAASMDRNKKNIFASAMDLHDRVQIRTGEMTSKAGRDFIIASHKIASTYRQSRRIIGTALLIIGIFAALILAVFDKFTVYEYSYNGKMLGYVQNQEDVTDILQIAGEKLTENSSGGTEIMFTANQNITFNPVDGRGKSTDDADTALNKLVYMTDIETEAYGVYDGDELVAVVKSSDTAENLLNETMAILSKPDKGMDLVSAEFTNDLSISAVNVMLTSVQSYDQALENMTKGGSTEIYHIVEEGETLGSLAKLFSVETISIFDESNKNVVQEVEQGDIVCIRKDIHPVSVKMVENGRMKEVIKYETIKKDSDDYYQGDTHVEQEGINGVQIFEGTVTKIAGEVTKRDTDSIKVITEKQDKIILIGTAERPKTAPTGTYVMPIHNYVLTSNFGYRWGRLHAGIDMGAPTGTPIYATDGGTVVKAEYYSGYGNVVFIQHEPGRQTRYAHCSVLLVNYGDKVYQGQLIALVGNTGHSFGSHLHFEVEINGSPTNPRPFLGI